MADVLSPLLGHAGQPVAPHDLWWAWNLSPTLLLGLGLAAVAYREGWRRGPRQSWRARCFAGALVAIGVALVSPLDALSGALASAHMVQHVLLLSVAAPLLALAAPSSALLRGTPLAVRRGSGRLRHRLGLTHRRLAPARNPGAVWLAHVAVIWFWHAAGPYNAALANGLVHAVEHVLFLVTAVLFWRVVVGGRGAGRVSGGAGVLLVFGMAMQGVLLSVLLTFARTPWYAYGDATRAWGLDPLGDQQLAGAIMWVPAGLVYVATALTLMVTWVRSSEHDGMGVPAGEAPVGHLPP